MVNEIFNEVIREIIYEIAFYYLGINKNIFFQDNPSGSGDGPRRRKPNKE